LRVILFHRDAHTLTPIRDSALRWWWGSSASPSGVSFWDEQAEW